MATRGNPPRDPRVNNSGDWYNAGFRSAIIAIGLLWLAPALAVTPIPASEEPVLVSLNEHGEALVGAAKATTEKDLSRLLSAYASANPQPPIIISADGDMAYEKVDRVLRTIEQLGLVKVGMAVIPPKVEMLKLYLPSSPISAISNARTRSLVFVRIGPGRVLYWNDQIVPDIPTLEAEFQIIGSADEGKQPVLYVFTHRLVPYKFAVQVMDLARLQGVHWIFPGVDERISVQ